MRYFRYISAVGEDHCQTHVPAGVEDKDAVLRFFNDAFHFPDWFGYNWDALIDCLRDIETVDGKPIAIIHQDVSFSNDTLNRRIYLDVMLTTSIEHDGSLLAVFPQECQQLIERELATHGRERSESQKKV